ncbi:hypothetical protein [Streptomyces sp. NPDC054837]
MADRARHTALGARRQRGLNEPLLQERQALETGGLKPRNKAVWLMTLDGLSAGEIADALGIKTGDVENARYTFRTTVKRLRKAGELHVPPEIDAEWARRAQSAPKAAGR